MASSYEAKKKPRAEFFCVFFSPFLKTNDMRRKKSAHGPFNFDVEVFRNAKQIHFFCVPNLEKQETARWPLPKSELVHFQKTRNKNTKLLGPRMVRFCLFVCRLLFFFVSFFSQDKKAKKNKTKNP
jgi:hypothetical protein